MKPYILLLSVLASTLPAFAASPPSKPAWQWNIDERLAARFDEAARNQRIDDSLAQRTVNRARQQSAPHAPVTALRPTDVIHGSDHPELLMPHEVFTTFTRLAFGVEDDTARAVREHAAQAAVPLHLPADFLISWKDIAQIFISQQREELQLRRELYSGKSSDTKRAQARINELVRLECPSRADAIRALRAKFGTSFDRFLYEVVAHGISRDFYEPVSAEKLRFEEGGCR